MLFFSVVLSLTACGQYGDLYAPPAEQPEVQSTQETQEQKDLQQAEEDLAE